MNIMILGHAGHGKTTLANLLVKRFGFTFYDTTPYVIEIAAEQMHKWSEQRIKEYDSGLLPLFKYVNYSNRKAALVNILTENKDRYRYILKHNLDVYCKDDPAKFINEMYLRCNIYAGCRSISQLNAAKSNIDLIFWVTNTKLSENDPTMEIEFDPATMIKIDNSGTLAQLEANVKKALAHKAYVSPGIFDKTWRDVLVTSLIKYD